MTLGDCPHFSCNYKFEEVICACMIVSLTVDDHLVPQTVPTETQSHMHTNRIDIVKNATAAERVFFYPSRYALYIMLSVSKQTKLSNSVCQLKDVC